MKVPDLEGYESARQGVAYYPQTQAGFIVIGGDDRTAFLQRQTTNDIRKLGPSRGLLTVLTSPTARILDVLYLLQEAEAIQAITLPGRGEITSSFLKSRIFFNDHVTVNNISRMVTQIDMIGPKTGELLQKLGLEKLPQADEVIEAQAAGAAVRALGMSAGYGLGVRLIAPVEEGQKLERALQEAGSERLSEASYLVLRVEAGQPDADYELTDDFTPLETGLEAAVAENKGCYTGQEVLARQVSYDKITQRLRGLKLDRTVEPGDKVWVDGRAVGTVTSNAHSPELGFIALAVIKRPHNAPGTQVLVGDQAERPAKGTVVDLPFGT